MNNNTLLIVDDEQNIINSLKRELRNENYSIYEANSAQDGLGLLRENCISIVLSDRMMPGMDEIEFLTVVKNNHPDTVRMLLTGQGTLKSAIQAINKALIFSYLTKPWDAEELKGTIARAFQHYNLLMENKLLHLQTQKQNKQLNFINANLEKIVEERTSQLTEAIREGIFMLATAAEARDDDTGDHIYRISDLTWKICDELNLPSKVKEDISFFSIMHDVGKIHIPDSIMLKPGPLSDAELVIMRGHCEIGERILGNKPFYRTARETARSHHEWWNGLGYPDNLKGESIPLSARITAIADVFDALTHDRVYKKAWPVETALYEIKTLSGKQFDPKVLDAFLRIMDKIGNSDKLNQEKQNDSKI